MLDRRDNGTVGITLTGKATRDVAGNVTAQAADLTVELRRPNLEELLDLWEQIDANARAIREPGGTVRTVTAMRANADWFRSAIVALGPPGLYVPVPTPAVPKAGTKAAKEAEAAEPALTNVSEAPFKPRWQLVREDLSEPSWFTSGNMQAILLGHWQSSPLDLGVEQETPEAE